MRRTKLLHEGLEGIMQHHKKTGDIDMPHLSYLQKAVVKNQDPKASIPTNTIHGGENEKKKTEVENCLLLFFSLLCLRMLEVTKLLRRRKRKEKK